MSTRIRLNARAPPLIKATTNIRVVIGRRIAKMVGFMSCPPGRLAQRRPSTTLKAQELKLGKTASSIDKFLGVLEIVVSESRSEKSVRASGCDAHDGLDNRPKLVGLTCFLGSPDRLLLERLVDDRTLPFTRTYPSAIRLFAAIA